MNEQLLPSADLFYWKYNVIFTIALPLYICYIITWCALCLCMWCVYVCVFCMYTVLGAHADVEAIAGHQVFSFVTVSHISLRQGVLLDQKPSFSAKVVGQPASRIHVSPPQNAGCTHAQPSPALYVVLGFDLTSDHFSRAGPLTYWAVFPAWIQLS